MKKVVVLILIVAGTTLSLSAQSSGRVVLPDHLTCLVDDNPVHRVDQVGPLCNPPFQPVYNFDRVGIDPEKYNHREYMTPGRQDYRPFNPLKNRKNISAPMPRYKIS